MSLNLVFGTQLEVNGERLVQILDILGRLEQAVETIARELAQQRTRDLPSDSNGGP